MGDARGFVGVSANPFGDKDRVLQGEQRMHFERFRRALSDAHQLLDELEAAETQHDLLPLQRHSFAQAKTRLRETFFHTKMGLNVQ